VAGGHNDGVIAVRNVSPTALKAMLAQETGEVFLICLTMSHPSLNEPYLLVNDQVPLIRAAGTFQPFAFDVSLPNEQYDSLPQVTMTIDNIDTRILQAIRNLTGERPSVKMEVVLASSPNRVEVGPFSFNILSINYSDATIQGTIGFEDDLLNTAFPADSYTPTNSKGLFA
jgi:hypothetical protein